MLGYSNESYYAVKYTNTEFSEMRKVEGEVREGSVCIAQRAARQ